MRETSQPDSVEHIAQWAISGQVRAMALSTRRAVQRAVRILAGRGAVPQPCRRLVHVPAIPQPQHAIL